MDNTTASATPHTVRFADIASRLPDTAWAVWRNALNDGEFADEPVLWVPGPFSAGTIDLARWPAPGVEPESVFIVVVEGDLQVDTLYNRDTDGCTGLIVLGNLEVGHAVVGGQEIFVTGDLTVRELFWGEYNHGALQVGGRIRARFLLATGQYHVPRLAEREGDEIGCFESDENGHDRDLAEIAAQYFPEHFMDRSAPDHWSLAGVLDRYDVMEALQRGEPVLKTPFESIRPLEVPRLWGEVVLTDKASMAQQAALFQALLEDIPEDAPEQQFRSASCAADVFVSRPHRRASDQVAVPATVVMVGDDGLEVRMWVDEPGMLGRMTGRTEGLSAVYKHLGQGVYSFRPIWDRSEVVATVQTLWNEALRRVEAGRFWRVQLQERVKAAQVLALLELPIVTDRYNDWNDPNRNGFWDGHLSYCFHRPTEAEPWAVLRVAIEREDGEIFDTRSYQFEVDDVQTPGPVTLRYKSSQEERPLGSAVDPYCRGPKALSVFDGQQIEEALRWYERCVRRLPTCVPEEEEEEEEGDDNEDD